MKSELVLLVLSLCTLEASGEQLTYAIPLSIVKSRVRELSYCLKEVWTSAEYRYSQFRVKFPGHELHFTHQEAISRGREAGWKVSGMVTLKRLEPRTYPKDLLISSVKLLITNDGNCIVQELTPSSRLLYKASTVINEPFYEEEESNRLQIILDCLRNPKKCVITHIIKNTLSEKLSVNKIFWLDIMLEPEMSGRLNKLSIKSTQTGKNRFPLRKVEINYPEGREILTGYLPRNPFETTPDAAFVRSVIFPQTFTVWNFPQAFLDQEGTQLILQDPQIRHGLKFHNIRDGKWIPSNEADVGTGFTEFPFCSKGEHRAGKYISELNTIPVTEPELLKVLKEVTPSCVGNRVGVASFSRYVEVYLQCENPLNEDTSSNRTSYNIKGVLYVEDEERKPKIFRPRKPLGLFYNATEGVDKKLVSVDGLPIKIWIHESEESKVPKSAIVEKKVQYVDLIQLKQFIKENRDSMCRLCDNSTKYVMTRYKDISVYRECYNPIHEMIIGDLEGVPVVNYYGQQTPESLRYKMIYYDFDLDLYTTSNDIIVGLYAFVKTIDYFKFDFEDKEVSIRMDKMLPFLRETFDNLNRDSPTHLAAIRLGDKYVLAVNMIATTNLAEYSGNSNLPTFKIRGKFRKHNSSGSIEDRFEANELLISEDTFEDVNHQYIDTKALFMGIPSELILTEGDKNGTVSLSYFARMNVVETIIKNIVGDIHKLYCEGNYDGVLNVDIEMEEHYYFRCNYDCTHRLFNFAIKSWGFNKHSFTKYKVVLIFKQGKMYFRYMCDQLPFDIYAFHVEKNEGYVQTGEPKNVYLVNGKRYRYFVLK